MIQIVPQMKIYLAYESPSFRCGIDGLAEVCREVLKEDPFSGALFIFRNRKGTSIKILAYDGQGFCIFQKRLSRGRFQWWPKPEVHVTNEEARRYARLAAHELQILLWNGDPNRHSGVELWRPLDTTDLNPQQFN
jgi:transposase